jgi:hypothetical protein
MMKRTYLSARSVLDCSTDELNMAGSLCNKELILSTIILMSILSECSNPIQTNEFFILNSFSEDFRVKLIFFARNTPC